MCSLVDGRSPLSLVEGRIKDEWCRREGIVAAVLEIQRYFRRIDSSESDQSTPKYAARPRLSSVIAVDSWEGEVYAGVKGTGSGSSVACRLVC